MTPSDSSRGYRYLPAMAQYSAGVRAKDDHELRRVQLGQRLPLAAGFDLVEQVLDEAGVAPAALCAVELRSPAAMSERQFADLNAAYRAHLSRLGALIADTNPVARTNVCPVEGAPAVAAVHAFTYAVRRAEVAATPCFVISGSAEAPEGTDSYAEHAIAPGDTTASGLRAKSAWVLGEMERRLGALDLDWASCTEVNVYSQHRDPRTVAAIARRIGSAPYLRWHDTTPPVQGLDFEMDCRAVVAAVPSTPAAS